ncbi:MAG: ribbon-helix-helix protein, CopG family [Candidatus Omnitrophica bacterium]|nr:ribbon-helix-helix protein, CopG family [Candidatus Omnitrophota bacterium]
MSKVIKTAISLPLQEFKIIESLRRQTRQSRSKILLEAIHTWLKARKNQELERRYVEGYRRHPEKITEVGALLKAGIANFNEKESW